MEKIKIAYITKNLNLNGISTVIMNYCSLLYEKYDITIITGPIQAEANKELCKKLNIKLLEAPKKEKKNALNYYSYLFKNIKGFDIVHVHGSSATIFLELLIAKLNKNKKTIAHSHSTNCDNKKIHRLFKPLIKFVSDLNLACGEDAGKWLFGKNNFYEVLNGFSTEKYKYNEDIRKKIREKYNLSDSYVMGHVGTFSKVKNHKFIIEIFNNIASINKKVYLMLVGDGEDINEINEYIDKSPYKQRILCPGRVENPNDYYNAMDCFIFPSIYEGFGISLIEAQINGLICLASDTITKKTRLNSNLIYYYPLNNNEIWIKKINEIITLKRERKKSYEENIDEITKFNIEKVVETIDEKYQELLK